MADMFAPTLNEQIAELERELAMRERAYPRWIAAKTLKQDVADRQVARLKASIATLSRLRSDPSFEASLRQVGIV